MKPKEPQWTHFILLTFGCLFLYSCDPDDPIDPQSKPYYVKFSDMGTQEEYFSEETFTYPVRKLFFDAGEDWYPVGMPFDIPNGELLDRFEILIGLPIDSARMNLLQIGMKYLVNDSTSYVHSFPCHPGSIRFEKITAADGSSYTHNEQTTTDYYNIITSVKYVGNRQYNTLEELFTCDYEVEGNFRMRIDNNISGLHVLEEGRYKILASVIAKR